MLKLVPFGTVPLFAILMELTRLFTKDAKQGQTRLRSGLASLASVPVLLGHFRILKKGQAVLREQHP